MHNFELMTKEEGRILTEYTRQVNEIKPFQFERFANELKWGTYGPDGQGELKIKSLNELDTNHLENIIITQGQAPDIYKATIIYLIKKRWIQLSQLDSTIAQKYDNPQ